MATDSAVPCKLVRLKPYESYAALINLNICK